MNSLTQYLLTASIVVALVGVLAAYLAWNQLRAKNWFRIWHSDGGETALRMKKLGKTFTWVDPQDKKEITWQLDSNFAKRDKKGGVRYMGDPITGTLMLWDAVKQKWLYQDPKAIALALRDGRVQQIAKAKSEQKEPFYAAYIMPALIIIGIVVMAVGYMVYKMYSAKNGGA